MNHLFGDVANKKRKLSGLSGSELLIAYNSLLKLKDTLTYTELEEETLVNTNENPLEGFDEQVDSMIEMLKSRVEEPSSLAFSSMTDDHLIRLNITAGSILILKPNLTERLQKTTEVGSDEIWSSHNLHRHLLLLDKLVSRVNEAGARAWIDAFFFRASAMLPPSQRMILNMEHTVPATTVNAESLATLSGIIDYTAIVTDERIAGFYLKDPQLYFLRTRAPSGFFVVEAKFLTTSESVPQAIGEMCACGRQLKKKILRGALTNGYEWIFLLVKLNNDYSGASYKRSEVISFGATGFLHPEQVDLIAAILSYWIENSNADVGNADWFEEFDD